MNLFFSSSHDSTDYNSKEVYLQHYIANRKENVSPSLEEPTTSTKTISIRRPRGAIQSLFSKVYRIPIFGEGLDGLGKSFLYELMWGKNPHFKINSK